MRNLFYFLIVLIITSCTKVDDVLVDDNTVPPDYTIENIIIENYINKLYISTIGREPIDSEFNLDFELLRSANLSQESREVVIDNVLGKTEYAFNVFTLESANLLNGVDSAMVNERIDIYQFLSFTATGLDSIYIVQELERLLEFQSILAELDQGTVVASDLFKCMVNNNFFDELNMGTENFVVAMFQHFLLRYPTNEEVRNSSDMVDDKNATVFFKTGNGKEDFIDIFFSSNEYYTGQTNILFKRYLFRNPTSEESVNYSLEYMDSNNYKDLQKRILSTDEFIGL